MPATWISPAPSGERGRSGLLNESALVALVAATRGRLAEAHRRGRLPLLVGGDCPVLLGALAAIRDGGEQPALVMLDGHEDAYARRARPPARPPTARSRSRWTNPASAGGARSAGTAAGSPSGSPWSGRATAPRSRRRASPCSATRSDCSPTPSRPPPTPAAIEDRVARTVAAAGAARGFWLRIDLDVLSSRAFAAVDYQQPGGIGWEVLDRLAQGVPPGDDRCQWRQHRDLQPRPRPGAGRRAQADRVRLRLAS